MKELNKGFLRYTSLTLFFTIFVVFAGSFVKVTGSGMGCPDWPKCFGYFVPPMDVEQTKWKANHQYEEGQMIIKDSTLFEATSSFTTLNEFNPSNWQKFDEHNYSEYVPRHTIIEYVNRLASTLLGVAWILMIVHAFRSHHQKTMNIVLSLITGFLIGFEAWLGKLVVKGVLNPTDISYHMLAAFVIILVLSFALILNRPKESFLVPKSVKKIQLFAFGYLLIQLVLGVVLRQTFDKFSDSMRSDWVDMAGLKFLIHRSSSLIYVAAMIATAVSIWKNNTQSYFWKNFKWVLILTGLEIASGAIMGYLEVPKFAQPVHVIVSSALLLAQSNLFFRILLKRN